MTLFLLDKYREQRNNNNNDIKILMIHQNKEDNTQDLGII